MDNQDASQTLEGFQRINPDSPETGIQSQVIMKFGNNICLCKIMDVSCVVYIGVTDIGKIHTCLLYTSRCV